MSTKNDSTFAISALDGRYKEKVKDLAPIFSEWGLMKYRLVVEIEIFLFLNTTKIFPRKVSAKEKDFLLSLGENFNAQDFQKMKSFEKTTNHDVKAVEYFLKSKMQETSLKNLVEYVHLGRTSEDINNLAYAMMLRAGTEILISQYKKVEKELALLAKANKNTSMLALTHGQPASPTTFGWEMNVFRNRLAGSITALRSFEIKVKLNGATGGDNALYSAYPKVDWRKFSENFIKSLNKKGMGMKFSNNPFTTQIEPHDTYRELFDIIRGANLILIDSCQDIWMYVSRGVLVSVPKAGEVGSSAMPQKVNPIDFENAEGNLQVANALSEFFGRKLTISRLQRDLTDSTVERNFGSVFGHSIVALKSLEKGFGRIHTNKVAMKEELGNHWEVVSEAYQVILRSAGVFDGYEMLKEFTRGQSVTEGSMRAFIEEVAKKNRLPKPVVEKLRKVTPLNYTGNRHF